jgi:dihydrodipicolinate synthase/N-acetylneuraminate lyase
MLSVADLRKRWQGVVVPLVTPFSAEDLSIDFSALEKNVEWLIARGAQFGNTLLLVAGSGGDFTSLNLAERKQVIKTVCDVAGGKVPIIAGTQSNDIRECIELCQFGEEVGLDAAQISGPYYYDGRPEDVSCWMRSVANHTNLGFALYNNWYTGYDMPLDLIDELLEIPNSIALKWSSPNILKFIDGIHRFKSKLLVLDNALLPGISYPLGIRCHISHIPNFYPEHSWRVHDLFVSGQIQAAIDEWHRCIDPWRKLIAPIQAATGAEGVFVRPAMEAVGLSGGVSRPPARDEAIDPAIREQYRQFIQHCHNGNRTDQSSGA